jgi:hypothetical protein
VLPAHHLVVAAVHRVGQKTFLGVLQQEGEEVAQLGLQAQLAGLQRLEHLVLRRLVQRGEGLALVLRAPAVHRRDRPTVDLRRRQRRLKTPLRVRVGLVRAAHEPVRRAAEIARQLPVDEHRHLRLDGARPVARRGDQARTPRARRPIHSR